MLSIIVTKPIQVDNLDGTTIYIKLGEVIKLDTKDNTASYKGINFDIDRSEYSILQ